MIATQRHATPQTHHEGMRAFDQSLPHVLLRAREATMRYFRPLLAAHELTEQQWRVLRALTQLADPPDVGELADRTFLLGPSLSRILANLQDRALIERTPDPDDQRRFYISLTTDGNALVQTIAPSSENRYTEIETAFGKQRLAQLFALLEDLADLDPHPTRSSS